MNGPSIVVTSILGRVWEVSFVMDKSKWRSHVSDESLQQIRPPATRSPNSNDMHRRATLDVSAASHSDYDDRMRRLHPSACVWIAIPILQLVSFFHVGRGEEVPTLIGYTELRTDLPGGRHANTSTSRAMVVNLDGSGRKELAPHLAEARDTWTQFAGWSPDGSMAIIGNGWQDPVNAQWEEEHKTFRMEPGRWRYDSWLLEIASGTLTNVTDVDRVSHYNAASFTPDGKKLLMTALVDGTSKPYTMELDGTKKTDVSGGTNGFTYGFNASPDGKRICYHENYQVYLANADGSDKKHVHTGHPFNFAPTWSPDGNWLLFVSGEHYDCHPHVVHADGSGLRKLADRAGYRGVTEFLDVPDFHGGSSDTPVWSADGQTIFYTAKVGRCIELFQISLGGAREQLTFSNEGTTHYHPKPSPDGCWLLYGSKRDGVRNIFVRNLASGAEQQVTRLSMGHAAMWPHWQPPSSVDQKGPCFPATIQLTRIDSKVTHYATFQSHNQKVVANQHGYFTTHIRDRDKPYLAQTWRLSRSTDHGASFSTVFQQTDATNPPVIETDADGNLYLIQVDFKRGDAFLYKFDQAKDFRDPRVTAIPGGAAGKYAMVLDEANRRLFFFSHNNTFHRIKFDGTVEHRSNLLKAGEHAILQYPLLSLAANGDLHAGWTTQKHGVYLYWDIHHMLSRDGGDSWADFSRTSIEIPVAADDGGPTDLISSNDEFESHTWLSSMAVLSGKAHFAYMAQTVPPREHYIRFDLATGKRDVHLDPDFKGDVIRVLGLSGYFVTDPSDAELIYFVGNDAGHVACLRSRDNGETWEDYARSDDAYGLYAIGGFRQTVDGAIIGTFTDQRQGNDELDFLSDVYFFRIAKSGHFSTP